MWSPSVLRILPDLSQCRLSLVLSRDMEGAHIGQQLFGGWWVVHVVDLFASLISGSNCAVT